MWFAGFATVVPGTPGFDRNVVHLCSRFGPVRFSASSLLVSAACFDCGVLLWLLNGFTFVQQAR